MRTCPIKIRSAALLISALLLSSPAIAQDYVITLKDRQFSPNELRIPVGQKVKIVIRNDDMTPAEFESSDLNREKVVGGHGDITVFVGPLDAGRYGYMDDFHRDSRGTIVAE